MNTVLHFVRVKTAIPDLILGNIAHNEQKIIEAIKQSHDEAVDVLLLPSLSLTGVSCKDLFKNRFFLEKAHHALERIVEKTMHCHVLAVIGLPLMVNGRLYACSALAQRGKIIALVPNMDAGEPFSHVTPDLNAVWLCGSSVDFGQYQVILKEANISVSVHDPYGLIALLPIVRPSTADTEHLVKNWAKSHSKQHHNAAIMLNAGVGDSSSDVVYAGEMCACEVGQVVTCTSAITGKTSCIVDIDYDVLCKSSRPVVRTGDAAYKMVSLYARDTKVIHRPIQKNPFIPFQKEKRDAFLQRTLVLSALGLARRLEHVGSRNLVIGISGGLDSTLALLIAYKTLDILLTSHNHIYAITMPGFGTSTRTKKNAHELMQLLGCTHREIDICKSVLSHFEDIGHDVDNHSVTYENAQARERTQILMDLANDLSALVIGTGDLSELALGWATFNGDHMAMYGVNAGFPKTVVRLLVQYCMENSGEFVQKKYEDRFKKILYDILNTPISPELLPVEADDPHQKELVQETEKLIGSYELHDFFLYHMLHTGCSVEKLFWLAVHTFSHSGECEYTQTQIMHALQHFCTRFFTQQFKRSCMPDGPAVLGYSLSPRAGFFFPSDMDGSLWKNALRELSQKIGITLV